MPSKNSQQKWDSYNWEGNKLTIIRDIKRHILTDYQEINSSYSLPPCSIVSNDIGDLLLVARYLSNLAELKSTAQTSEQPALANIDAMTIAQIVSFHNDVFTPAALANLASEYDEILRVCLQTPMRPNIQDTFFYSKGVRSKVAEQFIAAVNASDSVTALQRAVWNAFCDGSITDKLLRYAHEQKLSPELLSRATTLAFSTTDKPQDLAAAFTSYLEWSNEFRWYNVLSTIWSYIKWAISYGENYSAQIIALLNPEKLQLHRNTSTLNNIYLEVEQLKQAAPTQEPQQIITDVNALKQQFAQLDSEHIATISARQERLQSEVHLLRQMIGAAPSKNKATISELQKQQFTKALHNGQQQLNSLSHQLDRFNGRITSVEHMQQQQQIYHGARVAQQTVTRGQAARLADAFRTANSRVTPPSTPPYQSYQSPATSILADTPPATSSNSILADTPPLVKT
jgi:hypothetical protein